MQAHQEAVWDYKRQLCQITAQKLAAEKEAQRVKSDAETQQEAIQDLTAQKIAAEKEAQMVRSDAEKMASMAAALEAEFVTLQKQFSEVLRSVPELSVGKHTTLATVN